MNEKLYRRRLIYKLLARIYVATHGNPSPQPPTQNQLINLAGDTFNVPFNPTTLRKHVRKAVLRRHIEKVRGA